MFTNRSLDIHTLSELPAGSLFSWLPIKVKGSSLSTPSSVPRRGVLIGSTAAAITGLFAASGTAAVAAPAKKSTAPAPKLKFAADGKFKIVQFNDTQDGYRTDVRTIALQEAVLDDVQPDVVVINGDVIDGSRLMAYPRTAKPSRVVEPCSTAPSSLTPAGYLRTHDLLRPA